VSLRCRALRGAARIRTPVAWRDGVIERFRPHGKSDKEAPEACRLEFMCAQPVTRTSIGCILALFKV
jgi:hypothetical protein